MYIMLSISQQSSSIMNLFQESFCKTVSSDVI